jgi:glutamate synthase (NADPH/NADH) large chain
MASEVGVLDFAPENIAVKERLHPGKVFLVDTSEGRIIDDEELKGRLAAAHPYGEWVKTHLRTSRTCRRRPRSRAGSHHRAPPSAGIWLHARGPAGPARADGGAGREALGSMGTDTSLAVLSNRPRLLYDYFKQLFAQVTNPPLDAIREELVTSMGSTIGPRGTSSTRVPSRAGRSRSLTP